ncbi:threonine aldolase family protein [Paenibacillus lignilyticus]|uniref:DegT/DnrJ/EryC1/StrS family aminotransferase n=1 Tax=Paenibacillus lignilyticus TaxID=1172615 RepID=A0ABS5CDS9_9BACL|nr:beta-eliminating lyase-related protein [Paenibacillus lignilyticus]MBP3964147.1 DegT/DnrJ/EryC1/StrS family aminotransferase [Paenibacillus lignilyticus]
MTALLEAFNQTTYPVTGHSKYTVQILLEAFRDMDGSVESDVYGNGKLIEDFQRKMADFLGKESAVFFPSGTMAQQIALRIWSDELGNKKVAYHPLCHLEIHEKDGLKELHHLEPILLADKERLITLDDVVNMKENIFCLLLELPQREIGGQLPSFAELEAIASHCRERGIKLHLDGARLFEILPYYGKSAAEVCALFDSVYVSFYKGIGGIAGAILAGGEAFTEQSKIWKRRHGGDLISLYPYIVSSDYYFEQRVGKMGHYHESAVELAKLYNECAGLKTNPEFPVSNMFHVHAAIPKDKLEPIFLALYKETGIGLTRYINVVNDSLSAYEVSLGDRFDKIPKAQLKEAFDLLKQKLQAIVAE